MTDLKLFLIGYPGCGKSTYAKKIANNLNIPLFDTDKIISDEHNLSINEIFKTLGEEYFRNCEKELLQKIISKYSTFVMATGGGLACNQDNIDNMLNSGIVIYLQTSPGILSNRIKKSKILRPNHINNDQLLEKIKTELVEREKYYIQANHIINAKRGCEKEIIYFCNNNNQ